MREAGTNPVAYDVERLAHRQGVSALELRSSPSGVLVLVERPRYGFSLGERALLSFDRAGTLRFEYLSRPGENLLAFALHASGEATVVMASSERFFLARLDAQGTELARTELTDPEQSLDPHFPPEPQPEPAPIELRPSLDASPEARVVEIGEAVVLALRTHAGALLVYRYRWTRAGAFERAFRSLLVPPHAPGIPVVPDTATYDAFGQMLLGHAVHVAVDPDGRVYVATAVALDRWAIQQRTFKQVNAHRALLGGDAIARTDRLARVLPQLLTSATMLIALSPDGSHRYTRVLDFDLAHELYGMRLLGDALFLLGRTHAASGAPIGFDAFIAKVDAESGTATFARRLDLDQGDIFFDVAEVAGNLLAVGATRWTQNPEGFSVSSESEPLAARLDPENGAPRSRIALEGGRRFNELRSVIVDGLATGSDPILLGGAEDGPSSHTSPDEIYSDLYLARLTREPPSRTCD